MYIYIYTYLDTHVCIYALKCMKLSTLFGTLTVQSLRIYSYLECDFRKMSSLLFAFAIVLSRALQNGTVKAYALAHIHSKVLLVIYS